MGLAGGLSLMVLGETRGVEEAVAPGLVQTVMGAPGLANLLFSSWRMELLQNVSHQSELECVACVQLDNLTEVARPDQVFERTLLYETRKNSA